MTDQPAAEPTPGDWLIQGNPRDGFPPDIIAKTERGQLGIDIVARLLSHVPQFNGTPEELWANARLLASAKATAAERDRLVKVNEGLVKALEKLMAGINAMRFGDGPPPLHEWQEVWDEARAALDEARQP